MIPFFWTRHGSACKKSIGEIKKKSNSKRGEWMEIAEKEWNELREKVAALEKEQLTIKNI